TSCARSFFTLCRGRVQYFVVKSISDDSIFATSSRRCAVSRSSLASGPNGQSIASHANQNHRNSSSVRARSRARSFVGGFMAMIGEEDRRSFPTAQLNSARSRASVRLACTSARFAMLSITSITSRLLNRRVDAATRAVERRRGLAPGLCGLNGWIGTYREPAQAPLEPIERAPALAAVSRDAQRKPGKCCVEVFDATLRRRLHASYEQLGEALCRHDSCSAGVTPG